MRKQKLNAHRSAPPEDFLLNLLAFFMAFFSSAFRHEPNLDFSALRFSFAGLVFSTARSFIFITRTTCKKYFY
jgi:hypothetical protein